MRRDFSQPERPDVRWCGDLTEIPTGEGVLYLAIDFVYREWSNKAAGFVSYGAVGGLRAVEQLR